MCLALPARLIERLPDDQALVDLGGVRKRICITLVPEAQVGDHVIVHVGHAIGLLDAEEAERTLALFAEMAAMTEPNGLGEPPAANTLPRGQPR